jgi:hypothetical protein
MANKQYFVPNASSPGSGGGGGSGTVTSVAMIGDGTVLNSSVTGSPITTSGTLAPSLVSQTANTVLAGPTSGGASAPTFRPLTLASADFANQGTTTTLLHGNASGNPSFAQASLTADVSGVLPIANGGAYNSGATVGFGGFWGGTGTEYQDAARAAGTANLTANNLVRVLQFSIYGTQVVGHITICITTLLNPSTVDVGLYNTAGTLLVNAGGFDGSTTGNKTASVGQVTIRPQTLYLAWCGTSSGSITSLGYSQIVLGSVTSSGLQGLGTTTPFININGTRYGTAANSATAGVLPATWGP